MAVGSVAAIALVASWAFGPRALNAVAVPAVVALAIGLARIAIADATLTWPRLPDGHVDHTVRGRVKLAGHRGLLADASVETDGASVDPDRVSGVTPVDRSIAVTLTERGTATIGPATIVVRDRLGLWRRTISVDDTTAVTVFPRVIDLDPRGPLAPLIDPTAGAERQEFDRVRSYVPGDPLSDVHWKSTAKRPEELFVVEYADRRPDDDVIVATSGSRRSADALATATASIAIAALAAGRSVGLVAGDRTIDPGRGRTHRLEILTALAEYDGGTTPRQRWENATVQVTDGDDGPRIVVGDAAIEFDRLRPGGSGNDRR
ncbi:MAG: DUF58 domain-containing protein, partial [Halococcoides sp.]